MRRIACVFIGCALSACGAEGAAPTADPTNTPVATPPAQTPSAAATAGSPATNTPTARDNNVTPPAVNTPANNVPPANTPPAVTPPSVTPPAVTPPAVTPPAVTPPAGKKLAMDECGLKTQFPGDEYCIKPPPADKGFQFHIGPSNYENPEAKYVLMPGEEDVVTMSAPSGNDKPISYYYRQYRMRPGSHHVILTADGRRIGGTQNLAKDNPDFGEIPPENEGVGLSLNAHANLSANMHFYNFGEKPIIREVWVNFWYKDAASVKETAKEVFSMTGVQAAVAHSHVVVGATCQVMGNGRALTLYGHRHMNNKRFSIWHTSAGKKTLVFEDYEPEHPAVFEYNSLAMNPVPNAATKTAGASSGVLNLKQGDTLDFECEILNMTNKNFTGANEANDDEMCILVGDTVGASISPLCTAIPARRMN